MYAKTHNTDLIKYPYTVTNLQEENPYSNYDSRFTLPEWYAQTEEAFNTGYVVNDVVRATEPDYTSDTHYLSEKTNPELVEGVWVLGWNIVERPTSMLDDEQTSE
jgi:hypothetical protein